jgi:hypothetical protein
MPYTLRPDGNPLTSIPFMPNSGLLGLGRRRGVRGLGAWGVATPGQESNFYGMNAEGQACEDKNSLFANGYTGPTTGPWQYGGMWVTGPLTGPLGPVQPGGAQPATVYPILLNGCTPTPDTSRPMQNPMVAVQAAATAADAKLIADTAAAGIAKAAATTPSAQVISTNNPQSAPSGTDASTPWYDVTEFGIPTWGLLAAAVGVAALFYMQHKGGR